MSIKQSKLLLAFALALANGIAIAESFARGDVLHAEAMGALKNLPAMRVSLVLKVPAQGCLLVVRTASAEDGAILLTPSQLNCHGLNGDVSEKLEPAHVVLPAVSDKVDFSVRDGFTL